MNVVAKYVPTPERPEFYGLPKKMQTEIKAKLHVVDRCLTSGVSLEKAATNEAARMAGRKGYSADNIKTLVRKLRKSGWRGLVNKSKLKGGDKTNLPLEFVEYWKDLCLDHQRGKISPCYRELIRRWLNEENHIPGYGNWRQYWAEQLPGVRFEACPEDLPPGWNERNLRRYTPDAEEFDFAQYGIAAGRMHMPHVLRTRVGLRPLEWIAFDDWESDFMVVVPGVSKPVRIAGLVAKDVATDMWLGFVLRPAIPRADGTKDGLKAIDMKRLVAWLISKYGYPVDYAMNLVFERGTATLPPEDIAALEEVTGGMVISHPTSMITGQVLMSGFADKAVGSARSKGWIESGFNLLHNETAMLPGQKGLSWQKAPMELETRAKHAAALLEAGHIIPPDLRIKEALPFVDIAEAEETWNRILTRTNDRHTHHLEGFREVKKWRLNPSMAWMNEIDTLNTYPVEVRNHGEWTKELESPIQRFASLLKEHNVTFERVPDCALPLILADHKRVVVKNHQIKIKVEGKTYTFFDKHSPYLGENEIEYLAYFDSRRMDYIHLTDGDQAFKCKLKRTNLVSQGDVEATRKALADSRHRLKQTISKINSRESRKEKTRRQTAENEAAILAYQELQHNALLPDTNPDTGNATPVTRAITESIGQIQREAAEEPFDPLNYFAEIETEDQED